MEVILTIVSKLGYFTYLGDEINLLILRLGDLVTKYQQDILVGIPSLKKFWSVWSTVVQRIHSAKVQSHSYLDVPGS